MILKKSTSLYIAVLPGIPPQRARLQPRHHWQAGSLQNLAQQTQTQKAQGETTATDDSAVTLSLLCVTQNRKLQ